jgi:hypothetical protein
VRGRAVKVAGAGVVTQARPQVQHLIDRRIGQRPHVREALHEALVVGNDGGHLGLLQHDLGNPHPVGAAVLLPGKVVPPVQGVPVDQPLRDG